MYVERNWPTRSVENEDLQIRRNVSKMEEKAPRKLGGADIHFSELYMGGSSTTSGPPFG